MADPKVRPLTLGLHKTVIALGLVSFFTDLSSEMIYPLLPLFLTTVLGAGALSLGLVEGVAEATAALVKIGGGYLSDRFGKRKVFLGAGYGLSGFLRPLIGLAGSWPVVLLLRFADRVGKGIRTSPRDALIADVTDRDSYGMAYGFHRSMDHAGAVLGPLAAAALLAWGFELRQVFLLALLPSLVVMAIILLVVREENKPVRDSTAASRKVFDPLPSSTRRLFAALAVFTLGNSTDAFLLLRLGEAGLGGAAIALLWSAHHIVKMCGAYVGGALSDRVGRRPLITAGWLFYGAVYLAFALAESRGVLVGVFLAYGLYYGLTEPAEKAWIADLAPARSRGRAFGFYNGVIGLAALPASLLFGFLWKLYGAGAAFTTGALLAFTACAMLLTVPQKPERDVVQ